MQQVSERQAQLFSVPVSCLTDRESRPLIILIYIFFVTKGQTLCFRRLSTWDSAVKPRCFSQIHEETMKGSAIRSSAEEKDPVFLLPRRSEEALFLNPGGVFFLTLSQSA